MNEEVARRMTASILRRIVDTKVRLGKGGTNPEWVQTFNDLLEAFMFLSPQFAIYNAADRCKILTAIHITPVLEEERERNSAAAQQKKILQELAEKKERERMQRAHEDAKRKKAVLSATAKPVPKKVAKKAAPKKAGKRK